MYSIEKFRVKGDLRDLNAFGDYLGFRIIDIV